MACKLDELLLLGFLYLPLHLSGNNIPHCRHQYFQKITGDFLLIQAEERENDKVVEK